MLAFIAMTTKSSSNLLVIIFILSWLFTFTNLHNVERHRHEMSTRVVPLYLQAYQTLRQDIFDPLTDVTIENNSTDPKAIFLLFNRTVCAAIQMTQILEQARSNSLDIVREVEASQFDIVRVVGEKEDEIRHFETEQNVTEIAVQAKVEQINIADQTIKDEEARSPSCRDLQELRERLNKYQSELKLQQDAKNNLEARLEKIGEEKKRVRSEYNEIQQQQNFTAVISSYMKQVAHHLQSLYTPSSELYSSGMALFTFEPWLPPLNSIYEEMVRNKVMKDLGFDLINQTTVDEIKTSLTTLNQTIEKLPRATVVQEQCRLGEFNETLIDEDYEDMNETLIDEDHEDVNGTLIDEDYEDVNENSVENTTEDQSSEETEASITVTDAEDDETSTSTVISESHEETADESNDFTNSSQSNTTIESQMTAISEEDIDLSNGNGSVDLQTANFMVYTAGLLTTSAPNLSANTTLNSAIAPPNSQSTSIAIHTVSDLDSIRNNPSGSYYLTNNIDLSNSTFHSIPEFTGVFNGQGFTITNFSYLDDTPDDKTTAAGLFGTLKNGRIENIRMRNCVITSNKAYVGCLVGHAITSTIVRSGVTSGEVTCTGDILANSAWACGGLIGGFSNGGTVNECFSDVDVTGGQVYLTGGLVGGHSNSQNQAAELRILNSYSTGDVSGRWIVGGLSGGVSDGSLSQITISTSFSFGKVEIIGRLSDFGSGGLIGSSNCTAKNAFYNLRLNRFRKSQCGKGLLEEGFLKMKNFRSYDRKIWDLTANKHPHLKFKQIVPEPVEITTITINTTEETTPAVTVDVTSSISPLFPQLQLSLNETST